MSAEWKSFTLVFDGDLRKFKGPIFQTDTPFGRARGASTGDSFAQHDEAEQVANALADALLDVMKVMPPNGRTREQMDAMVKAGKAVSLWRDL